MYSYAMFLFFRFSFRFTVEMRFLGTIYRMSNVNFVKFHIQIGPKRWHIRSHTFVLIIFSFSFFMFSLEMNVIISNSRKRNDSFFMIRSHYLSLVFIVSTKIASFMAANRKLHDFLVFKISAF